MFQIDSVDKYDLKHPKKNKNQIFFKINLINTDEYGKMKGMDKSIATGSPDKRNKTALDLKNDYNLDGEEENENLNNSQTHGQNKKVGEVIKNLLYIYLLIRKEKQEKWS